MKKSTGGAKKKEEPLFLLKGGTKEKIERTRQQETGRKVTLKEIAHALAKENLFGKEKQNKKVGEDLGGKKKAQIQ